MNSTLKLLIIIITLIIPYINGQTESGLVAYYPFNGNANDESGNGNHGYVTGGVSTTSDRFGNQNKALSFNGFNGYIYIPNSISLSSPLNAITLTGWIKINAWDNGFAPFICKTSDYNSPQYEVLINETFIGFYSSNPNIYSTIQYSLQLSRWYFLAITWDGTVIKTYIDNNLIGEAFASGNLITDSNPLTIAINTPFAVEYLNGSLDDIRIYNRSLTPNEISSLFQWNSLIVENLRFTQRTDGSHKVDIYYNLTIPEGQTSTISLEVSADNGSSWDFPCTQISGAVGGGITAGINKHIVWDFGAEHPNKYEDEMRIKITAFDGIIQGIPCPGTPTVTYADKTYNTVQIGSQCWLKENLNVGTRINGSQNQTNNSTIEKYCYNDLESNCDTYGGLYQWNETMQYSTTPGTQGICPTGWHIPTYTEFQALSDAVGNNSNALKAVGEGSGAGAGTNTSGFSALLAGYNDLSLQFTNLSEQTRIWSSTETDLDVPFANYLEMHYGISGIGINFHSKDQGLSVRCIKN